MMRWLGRCVGISDHTTIVMFAVVVFWGNFIHCLTFHYHDYNAVLMLSVRLFLLFPVFDGIDPVGIPYPRNI